MTDRAIPSACSRRELLVTLGGAGLLIISGCSSGGDTTGRPTGSGAATIKAADIPVGGGKVYADLQIIVTQPTQGTFKAFSAICTHQQTLINKVADGLMICPAHGSEFSITDGSVQQGPATAALSAKTVTDSGGTLTVS